MKPVFADFEKRAQKFAAEVLTKYGYTPREKEFRTISPEARHPSYEALDLNFQSRQPMVLLSLGIADHLDGRYSFSMSMSDETPDQRKYFDLSDYIKGHQIANFPQIAAKGENIETFAENFFANLENACNTYLKDQITGVSFEKHATSMGK